MDHLSTMLAILTPVAAGLIWIGSGVWRIARWTERHDSRVGHLESWKTTTETRIGALEADVTQLKVDTARLDAAKGN
jgi:hypothetical protein